MTKNKEKMDNLGLSSYPHADTTKKIGLSRNYDVEHSSNKSFTNENKLSKKEELVKKEQEEQKKIQKRADILYGTDDEYFKKYYGTKKESDILKKYENKNADDFEENIKEKSIESAQKAEIIKTENTKKNEFNKSQNIHFSDDEIIKARKFIQDSEGLEVKAYKDKAGILTIGYGHTGKVDGKPITENMVITKEKAEELYRKDFEIHSDPLKNVQVPLTSNQKIALTSFIYNFGENKFKNSNLLKKLNTGDYKGASEEFNRWINARNPKTGKLEPNDGLKNRRKREKELFLTPDGE